MSAADVASSIDEVYRQAECLVGTLKRQARELLQAGTISADQSKAMKAQAIKLQQAIGDAQQDAAQALGDAVVPYLQQICGTTTKLEARTKALADAASVAQFLVEAAGTIGAIVAFVGDPSVATAEAVVASVTGSDEPPVT